MKNGLRMALLRTQIGRAWWLSAFFSLAIPAAVKAGDFTYTTNFPETNTITITGYTGAGGAVVIPSNIVGRTSTSIGDYAFYGCTNMISVTIPNSVSNIGDGAFEKCSKMASVTIPNSVTNIGDSAFFCCYNLVSVTIPNSVISIGGSAFDQCNSLTAITVDTLNSVYSSSVDGVLFNKNQTTLIRCPGGIVGNYTIPNSVSNIGDGAFDVCTSLTKVTIPNSVTSIGVWAFFGCSGLTSVTIPTSVTNIGDMAFFLCTSLTGVYFQGNAPSLGSSVFDGGNNPTVYYMPGTTGWDTFGYSPTVLWNPHVQSDDNFGVRTNGFGFTITGTTNLVIVVEACTNLVNPAYSPVGTNTLTGGSSYFCDAQWTNYPVRFYRFSAP